MWSLCKLKLALNPIICSIEEAKDLASTFLKKKKKSELPLLLNQPSQHQFGIFGKRETGNFF